MHAALRPGGRLLHEPQPWSSYRKKASLTPAILRNYHAIQLRPAQFQACLLDEVGFGGWTLTLILTLTLTLTLTRPLPDP